MLSEDMEMNSIQQRQEFNGLASPTMEEAGFTFIGMFI